MASYAILASTDHFVLIADNDEGMSVTNDASAVVAELDRKFKGGLGVRRLYYRDTMGRYDEIRHCDGQFFGFSPCTEHQQIFLSHQEGDSE